MCSITSIADCEVFPAMMRSPQLTYYPPRAGVLRSVRPVWWGVRRWMHMTYGGAYVCALPQTEWRHLWCLLVPGFSYVDAGWPRVGKALLGLWTVACAVFLIWIGTSMANAGFAAMLSIHVTSVMHLIGRTSPGMGVLRRLAVSLTVLFLVGQCLYGITFRWAVLPLDYRGTIYVVHRMPNWMIVKKGDVVAYKTRITFGNVRIQQGYVMGPILAGPGDIVAFTENALLVNEEPLPRQEWMPRAGTFKMPRKTWLIWPELRTVTRVNVPQEQVAEAVRWAAMVQREEIIGKPFRRWFWRQQGI